jgi:hypothetical protein
MARIITFLGFTFSECRYAFTRQRKLNMMWKSRLPFFRSCRTVLSLLSQGDRTDIAYAQLLSSQPMNLASLVDLAVF